MKLLVVILFFAGLIVGGLSSCSNPSACFNVENIQGKIISFDSIHLNEQIEFNGSCSQKANEYIWQVQSAFDTGESFSAIFDETFTDTGQVTISLTVVGGTKTDFASQTFKVIP